MHNEGRGGVEDEVEGRAQQGHLHDVVDEEGRAGAEEEHNGQHLVEAHRARQLEELVHAAEREGGDDEHVEEHEGADDAEGGPVARGDLAEAAGAHRKVHQIRHEEEVDQQQEERRGQPRHGAQQPVRPVVVVLRPRHRPGPARRPDVGLVARHGARVRHRIRRALDGGVAQKHHELEKEDGGADGGENDEEDQADGDHHEDDLAAVVAQVAPDDVFGLVRHAHDPVVLVAHHRLHVVAEAALGGGVLVAAVLLQEGRRGVGAREGHEGRPGPRPLPLHLGVLQPRELRAHRRNLPLEVLNRVDPLADPRPRQPALDDEGPHAVVGRLLLVARELRLELLLPLHHVHHVRHVERQRHAQHLRVAVLRLEAVEDGGAQLLLRHGRAHAEALDLHREGLSRRDDQLGRVHEVPCMLGHIGPNIPHNIQDENGATNGYYRMNNKLSRRIGKSVRGGPRE
mmetsp:Transcript_40026/g.107114  ORF Transcript_40026/g.107114 Transcript_40026/m.107114 type:complete len:456 (+) Transcript_40026:1112-2479(+)